MKRVAVNFPLLFFSLCLAVVGAEVIVRIFFSYQDKVLREKRSQNILTQVAEIR